MAEHHRLQYARYHDQAEDDEESTSRRIPGLDHLNPPSPLTRAGTSIPSQPSTPLSPKSYSFDRDIRKSIEPETPRHLLNRECTPAFEDRSCTPSPRSILRDDGEEDVDMDDASSPLPPSSQPHQDPSNARSTPQPNIPGIPNSRPYQPEPSQQQQQEEDQQQKPKQTQPQTHSTLTNQAHPPFPTKPTPSSSWAVFPPASPSRAHSLRSSAPPL